MAFKHLNPVYKIVAFTEAKRRGDINRIAAETGYTQAMVSMTLRGKRNNESIVNKAYRIEGPPNELTVAFSSFVVSYFDFDF